MRDLALLKAISSETVAIGVSVLDTRFPPEINALFGDWAVRGVTYRTDDDPNNLVIGKRGSNRDEEFPVSVLAPDITIEALHRAFTNLPNIKAVLEVRVGTAVRYAVVGQGTVPYFETMAYIRGLEEGRKDKEWK